MNTIKKRHLEQTSISRMIINNDIVTVNGAGDRCGNGERRDSLGRTDHAAGDRPSAVFS